LSKHSSHTHKMKLLIGLVSFSLGLVAAEIKTKYEPRCGLTCLEDMPCDNKNSAPLNPKHGESLSVDGKPKKASAPGQRMFGNAASPGMFPWMAGIYVKTSEKAQRKEKICGGSIINSRTILTAASCFNERNSRSKLKNVQKYSKVFVGFPEGMPHPETTHDDISETAKANGQGVFEIERIKMHTHFNGRAPEQYDAAVIILKNSIVYHESVDSIQKEKASTEFSNVTTSSSGYSWTRPACFAKSSFDENFQN